jgi:hypothetical protein
VRAALKEREQRLARATKERDAARKRHAGEVAKLKKALEKARKPRKLAGGWGVPGGAQLFHDHVVVKGVSHPLGPEVSAVVDSAGNISRTRRVTLTRFALMGPFSLLAQKGTKHDDREMFLLLEGPDWAELLKCDPKQQAAVRSFAQQFNLAARNVDASRATHQQQLAAAESGLRKAEANTSELEGYERAVVAELNNRSALEGSLTELDALLESYPEPQSRTARKAAEAADAADLALDPSNARSRLARAAQQAALPPGSRTETPPYWPPPPGWKPTSNISDELPPAAEQPALPPASGTNIPPYWPPPPGWTPTETGNERAAGELGDQQPMEQAKGTPATATATDASLEEALDEPESSSTQAVAPRETALPDPETPRPQVTIASASTEFGEDHLEISGAGIQPPLDEPVTEFEGSDEPAPPPSDEPHLDVIEQITRLGGLRDKGLITDDEFEDKKRELLERL